jgi:hypothetical protein
MAHRFHRLGAVLALALTLAGPAFAQPPRITGFTPEAGPPGTLVKIVGERLHAVAEAYFGGVEATIIRHVSELHLKVVVPDGARTGPIGLIDGQGLRTYTLRPFEVSSVPMARPPLMLALPRPSPAVGSVTLGFSLSAPGHARLSVFDIRGRWVRTLADGEFDAGPSERVWDGRDDRGHAVAGGLYFARLEAGGSQLLRRIVLIQ